MAEVQKFVFNPFQENTFVVYDDTKECVIIDAGCYSEEEREQLDDFIAEKKLIPRFVINTHCHVDHIFGNAYVTSKYSIPIVAHEADDFLNKEAKNHALTFGLSIGEVPSIDKFITDEEFIEFGNTKLKVIHVPGHSPGGVAFYNSESNFIIVGDILFDGSIGRTDLPGGNYDQLITGINEKLFTLNDDLVVYTGHGNETTIGKEKATNPFLS